MPDPCQILTALAATGWSVTLSFQAGQCVVAAFQLGAERIFAPPTVATLEQAVYRLAAEIAADQPQGRFGRWYDPVAAGLKPMTVLRVEGDERKGALPGGAEPAT